MTGAREEALEWEEAPEQEKALEHIPCIHYLVQFTKYTSKAQVQALINSGSKVNAIHLIFAKQLGLPIKLTDVGAQKIDGITLNTYEIVVTAFSVVNNAN